jgi:CBS domain-containing protein
MHDIAEFLGGRDPFRGLDEDALERLAAETEVEFFPAGATIYPPGAGPQDVVRVVRRGAVELVEESRVVDLIEEGELFGSPTASSPGPVRAGARAAEDSLTYALPAAQAVPLLGGESRLVVQALARELRGEPDRAGVDIGRQPASALIRRPPVICTPDTTLREAARLMVDERVGSVLVRLDPGKFGIVTGRDLRSRVIVDGVSADDPVSRAMTTPVIGVGPDDTAADVMLAMLDHDIRHVPVFSPGSEILGVIAGIDLVAAEVRTPFVLRRVIGEAKSREELREAALQLSSTVVALHRSGLPPSQISEMVSAVADALVRRMIALAIETRGPAPAEFAWLALGSHGRREPVPSSDVDSGMAWRDGDAAAGYMHALAEDVADCIQVLGWRLDPHGVTASGAFSASSIEDWRRAIRTWLGRPSDNRVLIATSILLDGRVIYGAQHELDVRPLLFETGDRDTLLRWMLRLALSSKPPTGFLRADIRITPTVERLWAAADAGSLDRSQARVLEEAFDLFSGLRMEHQVEQLEAGTEPDNHIDPKRLNTLARRYLRDAFREVAAIQRSLVPGLEGG